MERGLTQGQQDKNCEQLERGNESIGFGQLLRFEQAPKMAD